MDELLNMTPEEFAEWLRVNRRRNGLTQRALSNLTGISPCAIAWYEGARRLPGKSNMRKLYGALHHEEPPLADGVQPTQQIINDPDLASSYNKLSIEGKLKVLEFIHVLRGVPRYWRG